ncbi:hypothetical protein [Mesorhizobium sp. Root102]|uniref:hypothetical protein n=1 Tax=Mesorhizobium sp. Root102 TaxID=1736422 RepID=UPI001FCD37F3|nr:hypothetical protein [Mesorhizobium sp. Root102]
MTNPSVFGSGQNRGVLIPICSWSGSVTFRESDGVLTWPEVCQQSEGRLAAPSLFRSLALLTAAACRRRP